MIKRIDLSHVIAEANVSEEDKKYDVGKCSLCGKLTTVDQFNFCAECGNRMVRLDNIPLLTIVPIPRLKIDWIKIPEAFKTSAHVFKQIISK